MKSVYVKIKGTKPILFHAFRIEAISNIAKEKSGSAGNDPEEWKYTVLEKDNQLYVPASYIASCLKEASKHTKAGRGSIQKSFISCCTIMSELLMIDRYLPEGWQKMTATEFPRNSNDAVYLDIRGVMNPNSKGRNVRYRVACSPGWKTEYEFEFDETIVSSAQVKNIIENSGKLVGIGDGRVLGYGRFIIEDIKIE